MNFKKRILIYSLIAIITLTSLLFIYFRYFNAPPRKAVNSFMRYLIEEKTEKYLEYINNDLANDMFLTLIQDQIITDYKILHIEELSTDNAKVWVTLIVPEGQVRVAFYVIKGETHWYISELPRLELYHHGLPIKHFKSEKEIFWTMDVGGESIDITLPPSFSNLELGTPISFMTLDGNLIYRQELLPLNLTRVLSLTNEVVEDINAGYFKITGDFPVYMDEGGHFTYLGNHGIPLGYNNVTLYRSKDGLGRMAILPHTHRHDDKVRVILQKTDHKGLLHNNVKITSDQNFTVRSLVNNIDYNFAAGDIIEFRPVEQEVALYKDGELLDASIFRWYIIPYEGSMLKVLTIDRTHSTNGTKYRGHLETTLYNQELALINEVNLEEYLYSVVPSEMPVRFGLESLKVQAVAARSYVVRSMKSSGYRFYGAHVDDSTASQVYNNTIEHDITIQAVNDTAGIVPFFNDEVVDARFFSTSCGYTASFHEVWSSRNNSFPAIEVPYLVASPQYPGDSPSLYNEKNFRAFINQADLPGYDKFSSFFRWDVSFTRRQLEASLNQNLSPLQKSQPSFVLTRGSDGAYETFDIPQDIGELLSIEVVKRGTGGNIMELEITTTHGTFKIIKEYNVRLALRPINYLNEYGDLELKLHDGTNRKNFPLLPSAFAYIDFTRDADGDIQVITIYGGGYGHGVGMSQYGTYGLTLMGKSYEQIIAHYYPDSTLANIYAYLP